MHFHTSEEARLHSDRALEHMRRYGVSPTPDNYAIWYEYALGANSDLVRSIDALITNQVQVTEFRSNELYQTFIAAGSETAEVLHISERLRELLNAMVETLWATAQDTKVFGCEIEQLRATLAGEASIDGLGAIVASLTTNTRKVMERNKELNRALNDTVERMARVESDLETIQRDALMDPLTGISNRRAFDDSLRKAAATAERDGTPMSLVIGDIDHFKHFNDTFGHQIGDEVLRLVGKVIGATIRASDIAARYGGEEFAVILPDAPIHIATSKSESIRQAISSRKIVKRVSGKPIGNITMSFGAAQLRPGETIAALVERADAALYESKRSGRNQVTCGEPMAERPVAVLRAS